MSANQTLSLMALFFALLVGGSLVAVAAGKNPGEQGVFVAGGEKFEAALLADTLGIRPVETDATGRLEMEVSPDGRSLSYRLTVAALEDAFMSHLHFGTPEDRYGPIVAWLFPAEGKRREVVEGRFDGVLATGVIRAEDLGGPLGQKEISDLVAAIEAGNIFADVHTRRHVPGELRGQVVSAP